MHWLEDRAEEFADILTNVAGDENKVIRTMIHFDERRPLKDADLADWIPCLPSVETKAGFYCYEDAGMTTGAFLASQSLRFRVTGDPREQGVAIFIWDSAEKPPSWRQGQNARCFRSLFQDARARALQAKSVVRTIE